MLIVSGLSSSDSSLRFLLPHSTAMLPLARDPSEVIFGCSVSIGRPSVAEATRVGPPRMSLIVATFLQHDMSRRVADMAGL